MGNKIRVSWGAIAILLSGCSQANQIFAKAGFHSTSASAGGGSLSLTFTPSASGTMIPFTSSQITDSQGNVWTLATAGNGTLYFNGKPVTQGTNATLALYYNQIVYYQNHSSTWYSCSNGACTIDLSGDPRTAMPSPSPSAAPSSAPSVAPSTSPTASPTFSPVPLPSTSPGPGHVWYIRPDGGTRYSAARIGAGLSGQCNGLANAPYPGTGVNQACAFNDYRFLWDDQTPGNAAWVISGGDTVILQGGPWRVGWDAASGASNTFCNGAGASCTNPTIPAGTAGQHTRILGQNYASCSPANSAINSSNSNLTQIFGGFGVGEAINLGGAQYVDLECLEVTRHSQCISRSSVCKSGQPCPYNGWGYSDPMPLNPGTNMCGASDDTDSNGIATDRNMHDITMQDMWIHGNGSGGLQGAIGGAVTMTRVNVSFNGMAGWNFDDGASDDIPNAPGSSISASYVTMIGNGCFEEYPIVHPQFPAVACYDLYSGGFGDSWSGQDSDLTSFTCDHCVQAYNTKDGQIGPHMHISNLSFTNSAAYGNMGEQWKWGAADMSNGPSTWVFENNLAIGNCARLSQPMPGAASNYNAFLTDFCRASGDTFSVPSSVGTTMLFANNSIVSYSDVVFDLPCGTTTCTYTPTALSCTGGSCSPGSASTWTVRNNIILSMLDTNCQTAPNAAQGCGGNSGTESSNIFFGVDPNINFGGDHNIYYNDRAGCQVGNTNIPGGTCVDPLFVGEPSTTISSESQMDNFNFNLQSGSPAKGTGVSISGLTLNYLGSAYGSPPDIGAY